jgi:hypothetical protein
VSVLEGNLEGIDSTNSRCFKRLGVIALILLGGNIWRPIGDRLSSKDFPF